MLAPVSTFPKNWKSGGVSFHPIFSGYATYLCMLGVMNQPEKVERVCVMHYNQSQANTTAGEGQKPRNNNDDEYVAQIEGADRIWKSILANEETVKRQEDGLRRLGLVRPQKRAYGSW